MDVHALMREFAELDGAEVGQGPKHPIEPNLALTDVVTGFLKEHTFLKQDRGYVDFLECYAGAWVMWPNDDLVIDLFGFTEVSRNIANPDEGEVVDTDGFLVFCDGLVRLQDDLGFSTVLGQAFAFDATGKRKWGVYRYIIDDSGKTDKYWYCETFLRMLEALIGTKGKLPSTFVG